MLGPLPRRRVRCIYPLLPQHHRPSPSPYGSANRETPLSDFRAGVISELQSFAHVQASRFAATQVAPTAVWFHTGQLWRLRPSRTQVVTFLCIGYASRPNGQLTAGAYSTSKLPLIPRQSCHRFHGKVATPSGVYDGADIIHWYRESFSPDEGGSDAILFGTLIASSK